MKSTKRVALMLLLLAAFSSACETSKPDRTAPEEPAQGPSGLDAGAKKQLVERAQTLRDRELKSTPSFEAVASADDLPDRPTPPAAVVRERGLIATELFGYSDENQALGVAAMPWESLARFDAEHDRVVYVRSAKDKRALHAAIVAALAKAIDTQQFDAMPAASSLDEYLARGAAGQASVTFVIVSDLLRARHPDLDPAMLARRPELAAELDDFAAWLEPGPPAGADLAARLRARQRVWELRESWKLAAALYRSNGWSGVELARLMPPSRSADVVRPDLWMKGEAVGRWIWPEEAGAGDAEAKTGKAQVERGRVGPAVMSMWLEDVVSAANAQSVYAGYLSDAYRYFTPAKGRTRFEWLSLWNSPDSAQQVARAFEKRLRERFGSAEEAQKHYVVFQKGLKVGVIIGPGEPQARRERAQHLLEAHRVELDSREGLPLSFVPTRQDQLVAQMDAATMDERHWRDPATNLSMDLSVLGEQWRVQQPDAGPVRWFARNQDGSLLQLTCELDDPLGPDFGTKAYREQLVEAFEASIQHAKLEQVAPTDVPPERGVLVELSGEVDGQKRAVQVWQFRRDDLVVSYSLQASPEAFAKHVKQVRAILDKARPAKEEAEQAPPKKSGGIIEFEVEDEAGQ